MKYAFLLNIFLKSFSCNCDTDNSAIISRFYLIIACNKRITLLTFFDWRKDIVLNGKPRRKRKSVKKILCKMCTNN